MRRKERGLAVAFVVTVAGCGESQRPEPQTPTAPQPQTAPIASNPPPPEKAPVTPGPDGKCWEDFAGNPPGRTEVPCPAPPKKQLEPAPAGWKVEKNDNGTCTAYGPDPCQHSGCNPPPPRQVACPPGK